MIGLALALVISQNGRRGGSRLEVDLTIVGLAVLAGVVRWAVTTWRLEGPTLRIQSGLLRRDVRQLPAARIQAVDVVQPFLARVLGLAELRIRLAGSGRTDGRLAYLPEAEALALRAQLLALHHGLDQSTAEPPGRDVFTVSTGALVASTVLSTEGAVLVVAVIVTVVLAAVSPPVAAGLGVGSLGWLIAFGTSLWRRINTHYGFAVSEAPDGLRLKTGLLETTAETIPRGRIQALRVIEPLPWRPFGWCRLEVDLAGSAAGRRVRASASISRSLLPVGTRRDAEFLLARLLGSPHPTLSPPPGRARLKTPLRYRWLRAGFDDRMAVSVTGRVRRTTSYVPLEKVQSIRWVQGPVQRQLRLATLHLDSAGRGSHGAFRDREREEADAMLATLTDLCWVARADSHQPAAGEAVHAS